MNYSKLTAERLLRKTIVYIRRLPQTKCLITKKASEEAIWASPSSWCRAVEPR